MKSVEISKVWFISIVSVVICCVLIYMYFLNQSFSPMKHLESGQAAIKLGHFDVAFEACTIGVQEIGNSYRNPDVVDDSGLKESAALFALRDGKTEVAANTICKVLESRIQMLERP